MNHDLMRSLRAGQPFILMEQAPSQVNWRPVSRYQLVIAPLLYMVKPGLTEQLENFVAQGGTFLTTYFSGIVDETGGVFPGGYPEPLKELLGIKVEEFDPLVPEIRNEFMIETEFGNLNGKYPSFFWCDVVIPGNAKALASFTMDYYSGYPAITENCFGKGKAYYMATRPERPFLKSFLKNLCQTNRIEVPFPVPEGVELRVRTKGDRQFIFLMNHNQSDAELELPVGS